MPLSRAPSGALISSFFADAQGGTPSVPAQTLLHDGFPYGQCTYYVATRRAVDWSGNAINWWRAARGKRAEGHVPVQGAIVVFNIGWVGHVAYVEHVNLDGTFVISEMNYHATAEDGGASTTARSSPLIRRLWGSSTRAYLARSVVGRQGTDGLPAQLVSSLVRASGLSRSLGSCQIRRDAVCPLPPYACRAITSLLKPALRRRADATGQ